MHLNSFRVPQSLAQQSFRDDVIVLLCKLAMPSRGGSQHVLQMLAYPYNTLEALRVVFSYLWGTVKMRLWFLKFIFIPELTHFCVYTV